MGFASRSPSHITRTTVDCTIVVATVTGGRAPSLSRLFDDRSRGYTQKELLGNDCRGGGDSAFLPWLEVSCLAGVACTYVSK